MIGHVTILDAIHATARAAGLVERMSDQMERVFSKTAVPQEMGSYRRMIRAEGEVLVSSLRGEVLQRITGEELLRLPEASIRRMFVLERAMQNHYEEWIRVFPTVSGCSELLARCERERELRAVIAAMHCDVEELMSFLEQAGFSMDDHCAQMRTMIRSINRAGTTAGEVFGGTDLSHA